MNKKYLYINIIWFVLLLYIVICTTIMRFKHPEYTETELFLNILNALIFNYE